MWLHLLKKYLIESFIFCALSLDQRVQQSLNVTVFKQVNVCFYYIRGFEYAKQGRISSRSNYVRLQISFRKSNMEQKCHSYGDLSV